MDGNTIGLIIIAIINIGTAILTAIAHKDIRKIEVATNSMKDALVVSTAKASKAEGKEEQRLETAANRSDTTTCQATGD
jgi:hypothetical protein